MSACVLWSLANSTIWLSWEVPCWIKVPTDPRDSLWTLNGHLEAFVSRSCGESLCLNMDVHFDWPVPLDLFHTYTHPSREFTTILGSSPWPHPCRPLFSNEKKGEETRVWGNVFGDGWWKECRNGGKQAVEGEVMGSYTGSLYCFRANRHFLVQLACWLALLIEKVISVIVWLHIISEILVARSCWDINLIANF